MYQNVSEIQITIKGKTPIVLLSIIALIFKALSCIDYFIFYSYTDDWEPKLEVGFPSLLSLFYLLLSIAPYILFVLYILKFYKKFEAKFFVPLIFGLIAFYFLLVFIEFFIYLFPDVLDYFLDIFITRNTRDNIFKFIAFGLATFSALKGFNKTVFPKIALVVGFISEALYILHFIFDSLLRSKLVLYHITWLIGSLGTICFYIALWLFVGLPITKIEEMNPEQELRILKNRLNCGTISEEEYQAQRSEIINNL